MKDAPSPPARVPGAAPERLARSARPTSTELLSPAGWVIAAVGLILCVGVADFLTGTETSVILFYLAPIGFGTWYVSLRAGVFLSIAAAVVAVASDTFHRLGASDASLPVVLLGWNGLVQLGTSIALVLVLGALRSRLESEELLARTDALT